MFRHVEHADFPSGGRKMRIAEIIANDSLFKIIKQSGIAYTRRQIDETIAEEEEDQLQDN